MSAEPLWKHCSRMEHPERETRPPECPENATYIAMKESGDYFLNPVAPFPIIIEGTEGDDSVTVIGTAKNPVKISGGAGNDSVTMQSEWSMLVGRIPFEGILLLLALAVVFTTVGIISRRALGNGARDRY